MAAPAGRRSLAGSLGRVAAFGLLFVVLAIVAQALLGGPIVRFASWSGLSVRMDEIAGLCAAIAATAVMVRAIDVRPWRDVGLGAAALRPAPIGLGTLLGGASIGAACAVLLAAGWLRVVPAVPGSSLHAALDVSLFLLPAALFEELLCRGYLLTALRDSLDARGAVVVTSLFFGLGHLQNAGSGLESLLIVTLAGIFLGAVRVVFDSLYAAWGAHVAWNWVMAVPLHAPVSGLLLQAPDYRTVSAGPAWLTGGSWGPEGGLVAALGMVAALAYLHSRHRRIHNARPGREES